MWSNAAFLLVELLSIHATERILKTKIMFCENYFLILDTKNQFKCKSSQNWIAIIYSTNKNIGESNTIKLPCSFINWIFFTFLKNWDLLIPIFVFKNLFYLLLDICHIFYIYICYHCGPFYPNITNQFLTLLIVLYLYNCWNKILEKNLVNLFILSIKTRHKLLIAYLPCLKWGFPSKLLRCV